MPFTPYGKTLRLKCWGEMKRMANCPSCGAEVKADEKYCMNCGASLTAGAGETIRRERKPVRERDECFGREEKDYSGLVSFGFFIIAVGIVFTMNPGVFSDFGAWVGSMVSQESFVRPPEGLLTGAMWFFGIMGVSDFATAGFKLAVGKGWRRVLSDALAGVALILFAYLINLYSNQSITWQTVFAIEAVAVGLLVVLYSLVRYALLRER